MARSNTIFDSVKVRRPRMSAFDLSREQKLSCKMGDLVPTYLDEIVPGDQFRVSSEIFMRLAPMISPVMHRVNVYMHYFFVPNRIIWNQWEDFITGGREGTSAPTFPTLSANLQDDRIGTLRDYLGLPAGQGAGTNPQVSQLPFRAYQTIWNEYYRDQNLTPPLAIPPDPLADLLVMRRRAWEKDYFTSALPWPQRGPSTTVPIDPLYKSTSEVFLDNDISAGDLTIGSTGSSPPGALTGSDPQISVSSGRIENLDDLDISIENLRRTARLQEWLEKQARGGARYIETILSHFGKRVPDMRLQRPEYLGGGRQPIIISEVLNTTGTAEAPQGEMAGHGVSSGSRNRFSRTFDEHGYVMGIMSVLPKTAYQQGVPRHWMRRDKLDFYWPEFANLGEQEILNSEIFYDPTDVPYNEGTFGYQQRYAEYKYGQSTVHGDFRKELDFWHMGRIFEDPPNLNTEFVESDPTTRIFAVQDEAPDHLWVQLYHHVKARRPMPYFADPRL